MANAQTQAAIQEVNEMFTLFNKLCTDRMETGRSEYGDLAFMANDVVRMMVEELADVANYSAMQAVKLMLMQRRLQESLQPDQAEEMGAQAFKGTGEGWS